MTAHLIVFSQTGNTLALADVMADALRDAGHPTTIYPTTLFEPEEVEASPGDLLGVGCPTFFSRAPVPFRGYLSRLPRLDGVSAFLFPTSGGAPGRVLADLRQGLEERGASVLGGTVFRGEVAFPAPALRGRAPGRPDRADLDRARSLALAAAEASAKAGPTLPGGTGWVPHDAARPQGAQRDFYSLLSLLLTPPLLRQVLPKPDLDPDRCTRCGWCVNHCPVDTIHFPPASETSPVALDGLRREPPVIGSECIRCYMCLKCPVDAYEVDWIFADPIVGALYHPRLVRRFGDLERGERY